MSKYGVNILKDTYFPLITDNLRKKNGFIYTDKEVSNIIDVYQKNNRLLIKRNCMECFQKGKRLSKTRRYSSCGISHECSIAIVLEIKEGRVECITCMCIGIVRSIKYECNICKVPLYATLLCGKKGGAICSEKWHTAIYLKETNDMLHR